MAFRTNTAAAQTNNIPASDKAIGYINLYLPTASGKGKLTGIPLIPSKDGHEDLHKWLMEDPANVRKMLDQAIVDYVAITPTAPGSKKFLLG